MRRTLINTLALSLSAAIFAGCSSHSMGGGFTPQAPQALTPASAEAPAPAEVGETLSAVQQIMATGGFYKACDEAPLPGYSRCYSIFPRTPLGVRAAGAQLDGMQPNGTCTADTPPCYGPHALQAAYGVTSLAKTGGAGRTIAIVDAYGYPGIQSDFAAYRKFFGLPTCGSPPSSYCFQVFNQNGKTSPLPKANKGWDQEQALDIAMASALCPKCTIVMIQANSPKNTDFDVAIATALKMGAAVSLSFGSPEYAATKSLFDNHPGHVVVASSGDSGAGASQPCSFQGVVCVGGTSLVMNSSLKRVSEVVWNGLTAATGHMCGNPSNPTPCGTGSGCSGFVAKPAWQTDTGCKKRSEADVSAVADPSTGVVIACTPCGGSPLMGGVGGTSASAPMIAAMYVLAGNTSSATPATLWAKGGSSAFHDITQGTNEAKSAKTFICPSAYSYICNARKGYDGPTGWGTPNGVSAL